MKNITKLTIGLVTAGLIGCAKVVLAKSQGQEAATYATNISEVRTLAGDSDAIFSVAISPDGRTVVSGDFDGIVKVWDLATGTLKATLTGHSNGVEYVAISPNGQTIVSGSADKTIKVWDLATGTLKTALTGHSESVISLAISPSGKTIVSGSGDGTIKIWDLATGSLKNTLTGHSDPVYSVAISPNGKTIVSGSTDKTIKIWDLATGTFKTTLTGHSESVISLAISPSGKTIVSGGGDGTIKIWDLATGSLKNTLTGHSDAVASVAISPNGKTIVSGSWDETIKIWDLATGSLEATLTGHSDPVYSYPVWSVAISPDGQTIVSSDAEGRIKVSPLSERAELTATESSTQPVPLKSLVGVDYSRLQELLSQEKWRAADEETYRVMLKVTNRESEGLLLSDSIEQFSCIDLQTIDRLWVKYSDGRFGFSVQRQIYRDGDAKANRTWRALGWEIQRCSASERWCWRRLGFSEMTFNTSAPRGHLPVTPFMAMHLHSRGASGTFHAGSSDKWRELILRTVTCSI